MRGPACILSIATKIVPAGPVRGILQGGHQVFSTILMYTEKRPGPGTRNNLSCNREYGHPRSRRSCLGGSAKTADVDFMTHKRGRQNLIMRKTLNKIVDVTRIINS